MLPASEPSRITLDGRIDLIARQPFRATFHLRGRGRELTGAERDYVVDVICRWIERELG